MPTAYSIYFSILAVLSAALVVTAQTGPVTDLVILNKEIAPDGFPRQTVLADGVFPGPTIRAQKGDNFQINVQNQLTNTTMGVTTTIHWHGLFQHHTNWADGVSFVTQCPISPGHSFLYDFNTPNQAGTFWYHSHDGAQSCDGLRGPLIVYDPKDPHNDLYDVDDDSTVITLADWYHQPAGTIVAPADPASILINGLGRQADNTTSPLAVINVEQGKRYRFRLVSMSCDPYFNFTIDGHNFTIIEADGQNTVALPGIDEIQILAAQRYSFVLEANQPIDNYWIHVVPEQSGAAGSSPTPPGLAILHYVGAPNAEPATDPTAVANPENPLFEPNLRALDGPAPGELDPDCLECNITLNFDYTKPNFLVNNVSYVSPTVPVLLQMLSGKHTAQELMPHGSVITLPRNKTIQITMPGGVINLPHPLHLHGHDFSVIRSAGSDAVNLLNPVRRDTVSIGSTTADRVMIRFRTDNPGPWFLHCHIEFHLAAGFAAVMAEAADDVPGYGSSVPPAWDQLCPIYDQLNEEREVADSGDR